VADHFEDILEMIKWISFDLLFQSERIQKA
jgi:hypothetical protein